MGCCPHLLSGWDEFGARSVHVMLLSIGEFHEKRRTEGPFLLAVDEVMFTGVPQDRRVHVVDISR